MKIGFLYNFFRWSNEHFPLEILYEAILVALKDEKSIKLVNFAHEVKCRDDFFVGGVVPPVDEWWMFQEDLSSIENLQFTSKIFEVDIIIGFELSPAFCRLLSLRNIDYLNFYNAPIRFLPDLLWTVSTNSKRLAQRLNKWQYDVDNCEQYINRLRIKTAPHQRLLQRNFFSGNTAVVFAQMSADSSVLLNKKFRNLYDYKEEIARITESLDNVLFIPHPAGSSNIPFMKLIRYIGRGEICNFNSYALLCSDNVKKIISLSSSIGVEAELFDKEVFFMIGPALRTGGSMVAGDAYVYTIGHVFFQKDFWLDILGLSLHEVVEKKKNFVEKDFIRNLSWRWAYTDNYYADLDKTYIIGDNIEKLKEKGNAFGINLMPLTKCETIRFNQFRQEPLYWAKGLSGVEHDGRWSDGNITRFEFLIPPNQTEGSITFWVLPFVNEAIKRQRISLTTGNYYIGKFEMSSGRLSRISIPIRKDLLNDGSIELEFHFSDAGCPYDYGMSDDRRLLGLKFVSCQFTDEIIEGVAVEPLDANEKDVLITKLEDRYIAHEEYLNKMNKKMADKAIVDQRIGELANEIEGIEKRLNAISSSTLWKFFSALRNLKNGVKR